jgi:hypothetical protein
LEVDIKQMARFPIETAPKDGTEIIGWNAQGGASLIAWCSRPEEIGYGNEDKDPSWYRRAEEDWDLYDACWLDFAEPVTWASLPEEN